MLQVFSLQKQYVIFRCISLIDRVQLSVIYGRYDQSMTGGVVWCVQTVLYPTAVMTRQTFLLKTTMVTISSVVKTKLPPLILTPKTQQHMGNTVTHTG